MPPLEFLITPADTGRRLDLFLAEKLSLSRSQIKRLLSSSAISLNGHPIAEKSKGLLLRAGSTISVEQFNSAENLVILPRPDLPLTILNHGPGWLAVDKPPGIPVHPLNESQTNTLLNAVVARYPQIQGIGESGLRSGVVHRLDLNTSGVLLFATTQPAWLQFRDLFRRHQTKKIYRSLVAGRLHGSDKLVMDLHISHHKPARVSVVNPTQGFRPPGTRACDLTWRSLEHLRDATLVEIQLGTGFLHQIRVMLAHIGHPVLGDSLYGRPDPSIPRQMLHASHLRAGPAEAASPDPDDFIAIRGYLSSQ